MKNAMRHLVAFLTMTGLGLSAYGKAVDVHTAQTAGSNFLISEGVQGVNSSADLTLAYTASAVVNGNTVNDYYVFNVNGSKAFVMVAGDDIIIPILAYSKTSSFDLTNMAPATKDWIEGYQNQITASIRANIAAKAGTAARWSELQTSGVRNARTTATGVSPLVQTTWDQEGGGAVPYNHLCPNTGTTSGLSVTGCVSTAMAQLMKFWNWPTVGCGSHTYFDTYNASSASGSNTWNTADFANTAYDWAGMPLSSSNAAVATLMYHTGVSVNMSYSANESGSYVTLPETYGVNCAEYALKTYFHYKPTLHSVLRFGLLGSSLGSYYEGNDYIYLEGLISIDSMAETAWITMLQTELSAGHPMLYEGQGTDGGHCWICDGWETSGNMFHFNWGWSGMSDGYYTVENLQPPALGVGAGAGNFNYGQGVVMGVVPDSFPSNPGNIQLAAHLNSTNSSPMKYGSPMSITTAIKNTGTSAFTGSFCAMVYDTSNNVYDTVATLNGETIAAGATSASLTFSNTIGMYGMIPVSYHSIRVLYKPTGSTAWTFVANNDSLINYTIMDVINDTDVTLYDSLHVGSHVLALGSGLTVTTTIGNQSSTGVNFNGSLRAILVNVETGTVYPVQTLTSQSLPYGGENTFTFSNGSMTVPGGLYALEIQQQYNGTGNFFTTSSDFFPNPVLMTAQFPAGVAPVTVVPNDVYVYPNPANDVINILTQAANVSAIHIIDMSGRTVKIVAGANQPLITVPVGELASGVYFVEAQTTTGTVTKKIVIAK